MWERFICSYLIVWLMRPWSVLIDGLVLLQVIVYVCTECNFWEMDNPMDESHRYDLEEEEDEPEAKIKYDNIDETEEVIDEDEDDDLFGETQGLQLVRIVVFDHYLIQDDLNIEDMGDDLIIEG